MTQTVAVVGGGYAGLSFCEELRRLLAQNEADPRLPPVHFVLFSIEDFCNRPAVFFRLKFPHKAKDEIGYGLKEQAYYEKLGIEVRRARVTQIDRVRKQVVCESLDSSNTVQQVPYDWLVLAVGGKPRILYPSVHLRRESVDDAARRVMQDNSRPSTAADVVLPSERSGGSTVRQWVDNFSRLVRERIVHPSLHQAIQGVYIVRNVEEVEFLNQHMTDLSLPTHRDRLQSGTEETPMEIVIVGSGTLALDLLSCMLEGNLPGIRLTMVSRRDVAGFPLLDEVGARILTRVLEEPPFSDRVRLILADGVESLEVAATTTTTAATAEDEKEFFLRGVRLACHEPRVLPADILIFAIGVDPNTDLLPPSTVGPQGGLLVSTDFRLHGSVCEFACGDCCEFPDPCLSLAAGQQMTTVWRNWSCARETAIACASSMLHRMTGLDRRMDAAPLVFSQSLKLLGWHIYCVGAYKASAPTIFASYRIHALEIPPQPSVDPLLRMRLVVLEKDSKLALVGALVMSPSPASFRLGMNLHKACRLWRWLDGISSADQMCSFDWDAFVKRHRKSLPSDDLVALCQNIFHE